MGKKTKTGSKKTSKTSSPARKIYKEKKRSLLPWAFLLIGITTICLSPILKNNFTNWDDEYYVLNNALLRGPDWAGIFSQPVVSNYHPITVISLAINYAISGTEPWSYLLFNLVLHLVNTILVFLFIYSISAKKTIVAFLTALIFAIHPLHVESVAWVSERKDVLYTLFFLLSLLQYWRYLQTGRSFRLWFCFLFFVLSLLSKPAAIVLPLVLLLLDYWKNRAFNKKLILEKIPFFLAAGLFTVLTLKLQSATAMINLDLYPFWARLLFACYVMMIYFLRFFIPYPLSSFHPFPPPGDLGLPVFIAPFFVLLLFFFIWRLRKNKLIVFGFLFFLINILLVLQIISIGLAIVSERYTYVPYIGLAFLLSMLVNKYFSSKIKTVAWVVAIFILAFFVFLSFKRTQVWKDSDTLWTNVIEQYPKSSLPRGNRAQFNYNRAIVKPGESALLFQQVIEDCNIVINNIDTSKLYKTKDAVSIFLMRGTSFYYLNQFERAFNDFNNALLINPYNDVVLNFRGIISFNQKKEYNKALSDFTKALNINPNPEYFLNRSRCYYMLGDLTKARQDVQVSMKKGINIPADYRKLLNL